MNEPVTLREVEEADLPVFFAHQQDPVACEMAAFPPRDRDAFMIHWKRILADESPITRTILLGDRVAGNLVCYEQEGRRLIGYWLGREFWGKGVASRSLSAFVSMISGRPLYAYVATGNVASIRVLENCGFEVYGDDSSAAATGGEVVDEFIYRLNR